MCQQSLNSQSEAGTILFAVPCCSAAVTVSVAMLEAIVAGSPWGRFTLIAFALNLLIALTGASVAGLRSPVATRQRITDSLVNALLGLFVYLVAVVVGVIGVARLTLDNLQARSLSEMTRSRSVILAVNDRPEDDLRRLWQPMA